MWAGGLALQVVLILAPVLLARHLAANSGEFLRVAGEQDARWRAGELADSLSLAKQRADSRAAHTYSVTATGDTLFPLVRAPSGRPDPAVVAAGLRQTRQKARYVSLAILGAIPSILLFVTAGWLFARHREERKPPMLGAA